MIRNRVASLERKRQGGGGASGEPPTGVGLSGLLQELKDMPPWEPTVEELEAIVEGRRQRGEGAGMVGLWLEALKEEGKA